MKFVDDDDDDNVVGHKSQPSLIFPKWQWAGPGPSEGSLCWAEPTNWAHTELWSTDM